MPNNIKAFMLPMVGYQIQPISISDRIRYTGNKSSATQFHFSNFIMSRTRGNCAFFKYSTIHSNVGIENRRSAQQVVLAATRSLICSSSLSFLTHQKVIFFFFIIPQRVIVADSFCFFLLFTHFRTLHFQCI